MIDEPFMISDIAVLIPPGGMDVPEICAAVAKHYAMNNDKQSARDWRDMEREALADPVQAERARAEIGQDDIKAFIEMALQEDEEDDDEL
jgi:hypothetical protein